MVGFHLDFQGGGQKSLKTGRTRKMYCLKIGESHGETNMN